MAIIKFKINQEEHYIEGWWIQNDTTGTTDVIEKIWSGTKAEYDLLWTYDPDIYYIITDEGGTPLYIVNNTTGTTGRIKSFWYGTLEEFNALTTKDNDCLYYVEVVKAPTDLEAVVNTDTATLTWIDPADDGQSIWQNTKIVRKANSEPTSISDWTLVVTETTRNQYQTTWYDDTGLTAWTYFYKAFATFSKWQVKWSSAVEVEIL